MAVAPEELKTYVMSGIKQRYDVLEAERSSRETQAVFVQHGGRWDIGYEALADRLARCVMAIATDYKQADALLAALFSKAEVVPGESGGDHHSGYFQDYDVSTKEMLAPLEDLKKLRGQQVY